MNSVASAERMLERRAPKTDVAVKICHCASARETNFSGGGGHYGLFLGPPVVPFHCFFFGWEGSPTKIGYRKKGTLILTSLLGGARFHKVGGPHGASKRVLFLLESNSRDLDPKTLAGWLS